VSIRAMSVAQMGNGAVGARCLPERAVVHAHATVPLFLPRSAEKAQDHA